MKKESNIHLDPIFKLDFFKWTILANQLIIFVFLVLLRFLCFSVNLCLLIDRYKSEEKKSLKMCIARFAWAVNRKTELKFYQKKRRSTLIQCRGIQPNYCCFKTCFVQPLPPLIRTAIFAGCTIVLHTKRRTTYIWYIWSAFNGQYSIIHPVQAKILSWITRDERFYYVRNANEEEKWQTR